MNHDLIKEATEAVYKRDFYAAWPEHPKAYAENGVDLANAWFNALQNNSYTELLQAPSQENVWLGDEVSPYMQERLNISYPYYDAATLVERANAVRQSWQTVDADTRAAILVEALEAVKERFFDIALATMHTSGQSFMMAFQASGPHANDRALEAVVIGLKHLKEYPTAATWVKPMGKFEITVEKKWKALGRGISLVIGCSTFPVWNTVPGMFASLITGNPVIVKPHPGAILPIAIVVAELQKVLKKHNLSAHIAQLAVDSNSTPLAVELAENPLVKLIDYTGNTHFGDRLEAIPGKVVFTEKAGVNSVILHSVSNLEQVVQNLAFSLSLYSGQMCTAPQNFFVPEGGVYTPDGSVSYDEFVEMLTQAVVSIAENPKMAAGTLGAIQNPDTHQRVTDALSLGAKVLLESRTIMNADYPDSRTATPVVLEVDATQEDLFARELFGPIAIIIKTKDINHSVQLARELAETKGAISCGAYTTDAMIQDLIATQMEMAFTPVAFNLTGPIWMNQNAAFSDFHVTGGNPAGNASFSDTAYLVRRFVWVGHKYAK